MSATTTSQLARAKLSRLAHVGLDSFAYRERAIVDLRAALPFDAAWWWTIDPASASFTSGVFRPLPADHAICGGQHSYEFSDTDYNKFRVLARRTGKAAGCSAPTPSSATVARTRSPLTPPDQAARSPSATVTR